MGCHSNGPNILALLFHTLEKLVRDSQSCTFPVSTEAQSIWRQRKRILLNAESVCQNMFRIRTTCNKNPVLRVNGGTYEWVFLCLEALCCLPECQRCINTDTQQSKSHADLQPFMLIQGQHCWFDCFFTTAVNLRESLDVASPAHWSQQHLCNDLTRCTPPRQAKLRRGSQDGELEKWNDPRFNCGRLVSRCCWATQPVQVSLLHWSCHVSQKQDIMWRRLSTCGRERVLANPMNMKQVVAEKQRACPAKMHGQIKDLVGHLQNIIPFHFLLAF